MTNLGSFRVVADFAYDKFLQEVADLAATHGLTDEEAVEAVRTSLGWDIGDNLEDWLNGEGE